MVKISQKEKIVNLSNFMKKFSKKWIINQAKLLFLFLIFLILSFFWKLPYFNLVLTLSLNGLFIWIICLILFKFNSKVTLGLSILTVFLSVLINIFQGEDLASELSNLSYYLFLIGFLQSLLEKKYGKNI